MKYKAYLLLGARHLKGDNVKNGHLFPATLEAQGLENSVEVSRQSCCGQMELSDEFNIQENRLFIYTFLQGEIRPKLRKWGKSEFRYFDREDDFRLSLAKFHEKDSPDSSLCAKCVGVFYAHDDVQ